LETEGTVAAGAGAPTDGVTTAARLEAAAALRRLANAFVAHQVDDEVLSEITSRVDALLPDVERAPARPHSFLAHGTDFLRERMKGDDASQSNSVFPDCIVSGQASPVGMNATLWREHDEAVLEVTLGPAFEGAPGRAHGGVVAALIDELMGLALTMADTLAFTGNLSVTYRSPLPSASCWRVGPVSARGRGERSPSPLSCSTAQPSWPKGRAYSSAWRRPTSSAHRERGPTRNTTAPLGVTPDDLKATTKKEANVPAVTVQDNLTLDRIAPIGADQSVRAVKSVTEAPSGFEGEGFPVRRAFTGVPVSDLDPFIHMDQMGEVEYAPGEPKGTPWHPHRGFETVTYMIDGTFQHQDSIGGGGLISNGSTQWMTAGAGILHIERPPEQLIASGGLFHGIQLWVNLPAADKMVDPRYQDLEANDSVLLTSPDGGALVRVIAGDVAGHRGPGRPTPPSPWSTLPCTPARPWCFPGRRTTTRWSTCWRAMARSGPNSGRSTPATSSSTGPATPSPSQPTRTRRRATTCSMC